MTDTAQYTHKTNGPHWEELSVVGIHPRGEFFVVAGPRPGGYPPSITGYDILKGKHLFSLDDFSSHATTLLFPDDNHLLSGHDNGEILLWDISKKKPKPLAQQAIALGTIHSLAFNPNTQEIYAGGTDNLLHLCHMPSLQPKDVAFVWPDTETIFSLVCDPQGQWIAVAGITGTIRIFAAQGGEPTRVMEGHEGPVYTMLYHPQESRLISAGEDRTIRFWYLQGDIEFEDRAANQSHSGPIRCMKLGPTWKEQSGEILPPRLLTGSDDGTIKIWPLHNKRAPKTIAPSKSPVAALDVASHAENTVLITGNAARVISGWRLNQQTELESEDAYLLMFSVFHQLRYKLRSGQTKERKESLQELADLLEDPAVFEAVLKVMEDDKEPELRSQAALALIKTQHRRPIREIRAALQDNHTSVRKTALQALRQLQGQTSLAPFESALQSQYEDTRCLAIQELVPLQKHSPLAVRLIRQALSDQHLAVQKEALEALETLYPSSPKNPDPTPFLIALQEGSLQLKQEVLHRIHGKKWSQLPAFHAPFLQLLESSDEQLRRTTFLVMLSGNSSLAEPLQILDDGLQRQFLALQEKITHKKDKEATRSSTTKSSKSEQQSALAQLQSLQDSEKQLLFLGLSSRYPDIALQSAMLLSRFHDLRALGTLLQLGQEKQPELRKETALALRYLSDTRAQEGLVQLLQDREKDVRDAAYESLESLCENPLDVARFALLAPHADLRHRALQKLVPKKKAAELSTQAIDLLTLALSDADESARNEAFKILWNALPQEPQRVLQAALQSQQYSMRQKAIDEIKGAFPETPWGRKILLQTLHDPEEKIRRYAYDALCKIYSKDDYTPQKEALQTPYTALRLEALQQLHKAKKSELQPILLDLLRDEESEVRTNALHRLLQKYPKDNDTFVQALDAKHWDIRLQVAQHLASLGDIRSLGVAEDYLEEERRHLADMAKLYPTTPDQSLLEVLPPVEQQRIRTFRRSVITLVKTLGHPDGIDHITSFLDDPQTDLATETAQAFALCADSRHRDDLIGMLKHKSPAFRIHARSGLARLGDTSILPSLSEQLESGSHEQQIEALLALHTLGESGFAKILQTLAHTSETMRDHAWILVLAEEWGRSHQGQPPTTLLKVLISPFPNLRLRAAEILQHRGDRALFQTQIQESIFSLICDNQRTQDNTTSNNKDKDNETQTKTTQQQTFEKELPTWIAALTSELPALRYAAASLLPLREKLATWLEEFPTRLRNWLPLSSPSLSATDQGTADSDFHQLAFGTYAGLLRQNLPNPLLLQALKRAFALHTSPVCSPAVLQPLLEQTLYHPERVELRKAALSYLHQLYPNDHGKAYTLALACPHTDVGLAALALILAESTETAITWTRTALQSSIRDIRFKAAEQLQKLYPADSLEPFILALESEHPDVRLRVIDRLLQEKDARVTEALRQALSSDHDDLRFKAAIALAQRKENLAFDALSEFLHREDSRTQQQAVQAFLQLGDERAVAVFCSRYDNDPEQTADHSLLLRSLGQMGFVSAADWLTQKLEEKQPHLRETAYQALLQLAGPEHKRNPELYLSMLQRALQSKSTDIVEKSLSDIAELKHPRVQESVLPLLKHLQPNIRRHALDVLLQRIPELDPNYTALVPVLEHRDPEMRREAAMVLGGLGEKQAFSILFTTFQTSMNPEEQRNAITALGKLGDTRAFAPILAMFPKDETVHPALDAACEAVGRLAPAERQTEIRSLLLAILQDHQAVPASLGICPTLHDLVDDGARKRAIVGLRHVAGSEGVLLLDKMARELTDWHEWPLRQAIAAELGEINDKSGESALVVLLGDSDSDVRRTAARSLIKIYGKHHPRPYWLIYDHDDFEYEEELLKEASEFLAKHADPVDIIERLPRPNFTQMPKDQFLDLSAHEQQETNHEDDDRYDAKAEYNRTLEMGLLRRTPPPFAALLQGLKHEKVYIKINTIQILMRMLPNDLQQLPESVSIDTISTALQEANRQAITLWHTGKTPLRELSHYWQLTLWALGLLSPKTAVPSAQDVLALQNAPALVRTQAIQLLALSGTRDKQTLSLLEQAMSDPQEKVRRLAVWALSQLQSDATSLLQKIPQLPSASGYLLHTADLSQPTLLQQLHAHTAKRELIPTLLVQRNSDVFIDMFKQNTGKQQEQLLALGALTQIADTQALQHLNTWRTDQSLPHDIRVAAYGAWRRAQRNSARRTKAHVATTHP